MQQRRCFKPIPRVPLRVARQVEVAPELPSSRPAEARAAIEAADAFLRASARVAKAA